MLPLRDENPTGRRAFVTIALIAACIVVYFFIQPSGRTALVADETAQSDTAFTVAHAAIPCEVIQGRPLTLNELSLTFEAGNPEACLADDRSPEGFPTKSVYLAMVVSMFMHGGLLHLGGNMLFLWVFGNNIEDRLGPIGFALFYLVSGLFATAGHIAAGPNSTIPVVGASGAIAALMGAYLVLFPRARIHTVFLPLFFLWVMRLPAWLVLGVWFVSQFALDPNSGVAWVAHVAGFVFGVVGGLVMRARQAPERRGPQQRPLVLG